MDTDTDTDTTSTPGGDPGSGTATMTDGRPPYEPAERLHRVGHGRMLAGVAGGLADYLDVDPTLVRIGFVALAFMGGLAVPLYLAGWLCIPDEDEGRSVAEDLLHREWHRPT
jgi:phage shock protein PspC (stress-responsive transcriptional regulator)